MTRAACGGARQAAAGGGVMVTAEIAAAAALVERDLVRAVNTIGLTDGNRGNPNVNVISP